MGRRGLLWIVVFVVLAYLILHLRNAHAPKAEATLDRSALPTATAYARAVVSAARCGDARKVAHSSLGDPCKTFAGVQGERLAGVGRIVRGCGDLASHLRSSQASKLAGDDCVHFRLTGPHGRGTLGVWLARTGTGWQVASAVSVLPAS